MTNGELEDFGCRSGIYWHTRAKPGPEYPCDASQDMVHTVTVHTLMQLVP